MTARMTALVAALAFGSGLIVGATIPRREPSRAAQAPRTREPSARRVTLSALLADRAGIRTAPVQRRALAPAIDLLGSVEFDGNHMANLGSRVSGRIARLAVGSGAVVHRGEVLVEIESAAVGEAVASLLTAQARAVAARSDDARLTRLAQEHLATLREVEQSRALLVEHEAEMRSARQRLVAMGLSPSEVQTMARGSRLDRVTLRAPIDGRVVTRDVVLGEVVEPTTTVLQIADPTRLWVQLEVFERDLSRVALGDAAEITSEAYPGTVLHGTVGQLAATVTPETRTARVRIEVANPEGLLRPGQFVRARVRSGAGGSRSALTVPRAAIVQLEGRPAGFVATASEEYEVRMLDLGPVDGDDYELLRGVSEGELLVVVGAFALKSELLR